jgi:hypothetical protein
MTVKIPIKKYVMDESKSWEDRYFELDAHHTLETEWLIKELQIEKDKVQILMTLIKEHVTNSYI